MGHIAKARAAVVPRVASPSAQQRLGPRVRISRRSFEPRLFRLRNPTTMAFVVEFMSNMLDSAMADMEKNDVQTYDNLLRFMDKEGERVRDMWSKSTKTEEYWKHAGYQKRYKYHSQAVHEALPVRGQVPVNIKCFWGRL